jgi:hypothetical protein
MNVRNSTEGKLVAVDDAATLILWTKLFLEAQGYDVDKNTVYQDNKSAILLETNGKKSLGKRMRALNIHSFFITDQVEKGNAQIEHCGTDKTWSEIFLQSLCKARSSKDFGMISLDANATYQDTRETRCEVTQDKEQFEAQKISSSRKIRSLSEQLFIVRATTTMSKCSNATKPIIQIGVPVVTTDKFEHLGAMAGTKIPDKKGVKPSNIRYIMKQDGKNWTQRSTDRCPAYIICTGCGGSGPSGMHCQRCKT